MPNPVPLPMGLVVKKRLEYAPPGGFIHSRTVVVDLYPNPPAVRFDPQNEDRRCLGLRHGFGTILEDVHKDLLDFTGFAGYRGNGRVVFSDNPNIFKIIVFFSYRNRSGADPAPDPARPLYFEWR